MVNVAGDPAYATVREQLCKQLIAELEANKDPLIGQ
jgi:hypothetical protein